MAQIGMGIIAGLVATFLVIAIQWLWARVIVPWYEEHIYKDAAIEGRWTSSYPNLLLKEQITLERNAHYVHGHITVTDGDDQGKAYTFDGVFKNLLLTATYISVDPAALDRGTFTLLLKNNGNELRGYSAFYEDDRNEIVACECVWSRDSKR